MSARICLLSPVSAVSARVVLAVFAAATISVTARAQVAQYTITDLGTLGGTMSEAYGINAVGQVVGRSTGVNSGYHAFRSTANGQPLSLMDLGAFSSNTYSYGYAINASGQVTGIAQLP